MNSFQLWKFVCVCVYVCTVFFLLFGWIECSLRWCLIVHTVYRVYWFLYNDFLFFFFVPDIFCLLLLLLFVLLVFFRYLFILCGRLNEIWHDRKYRFSSVFTKWKWLITLSHWHSTFSFFPSHSFRFFCYFCFIIS